MENIVVKKNRKNKSARNKRIGIVLTIIGILMMVLPMNLGMDGMDGGFALAFAGIMVIVAGIVTWVIYHKLAKAVNEVFSGKGVIAYWTYKWDQWSQYTEYDYKEEKKNKMMLFKILVIICLIIGVVFVIGDPENGWVVLVVLIGLVLFIRVLIYLVTKSVYKQNKEGVGEVIIHPKGIYLNGQFHGLNVAGSKFESVEIKKENMMIMEVGYSTPGHHTRNYTTIRVPVPYDKEAEAEDVAKKLVEACTGEKP